MNLVLYNLIMYNLWLSSYVYQQVRTSGSTLFSFFHLFMEGYYISFLGSKVRNEHLVPEEGGHAHASAYICIKSITKPSVKFK